ncbi:DNA-directed RNA polymerase subunit beta [Bienertia sinuspersici]
MYIYAVLIYRVLITVDIERVVGIKGCRTEGRRKEGRRRWSPVADVSHKNAGFPSPNANPNPNPIGSSLVPPQPGSGSPTPPPQSDGAARPSLASALATSAPLQRLVFYEDVKIFVAKGFRAWDVEAEQTIVDEEEFCDVYNIPRFILALLDDLSNNGLCCLTKIVTRGSVSFSKTRPQMKKVIKNSLQEICRNQLDSNCQDQMQNQLTELLRNPNNFCQNHRKYIKLTRKSLLHALEKVNLQPIPVRILSAMHRKLRGTKDYKPQLASCHSCWSKNRLIPRVINMCKEMIYQHDESDKLQYPLVKAMAVPSLYSRIASNYQDLSMAKFVQLPPEVEALQNELVKAIQTLEKRFKTRDLKKLQLLLDPVSKVGTNDLRKAIRAMLIDYLISCNDMEAVPDSLLKALSCINKNSCKTIRTFPKEVIEEDVEHILDVGAEIKQLVWDSLSLGQLDQDFADAYMEELEESDDGDIFDDDDQQLHTHFLDEVQIRFNDFSEEVASTGDADHAEFSSATSRNKDTDVSASCSSFRAATFTDQDGCRDTEISEGEMHANVGGDDLPPLVSPMLLGNGETMGTQDPPNNTLVDMNLPKICSKQNQVNRYVAVQEVCDQASLVAYQLIGHILAEFGQIKALGLNLDNESYLRSAYPRSENFQDSNSMDRDLSGSVIVQAVHEVIPSFPTNWR